MDPRSELPASLGFIGAGRMAQAIAGGVSSVFPDSGPAIHFFDPSAEACAAFQERVPQSRPSDSNQQVCEACEVVVLAVKPQMLKVVATDLRVAIRPTLAISIAAGVPLSRLREWLESDRVIRVMPNTPCVVGEGVSGFTAGPGTSSEDRAACRTLFASVGACVEINEQQLDAMTGMSGSGPAYVYSLIEGLSDGGVLAGLPRDLATKLAIQTVLGSAKLAQVSGDHPALLREQVTSPGGTTARGLQALEDRSFRGAVIAAVKASTDRAIELSRDLD